RHPTVERRRDLVDHPRPASRHPGPPGLVHGPRLERVDELDVEARRPQPVRSAACLGVRVGRAVDDALDSCGDDRLATWRRRSVVVARLQGDVQRRSTRTLAGGAEGDDLRVPARRLGDALSDDLPLGHDDGTDGGLRVRARMREPRELDRARERHRASSTSCRYASGGSPARKIDDAATRSVAPSCRSRSTFVGPTPPSTWTWIRSGSSARSSRTRSNADSWNGWPEYPGWMLMQRTTSASPATAATASGAVSGLSATPAWRPHSRAAAIVAGTSSTASKWNVTLSPPASATAPKYLAGRSTIRCTSSAPPPSWTIGAIACSTIGPIVIGSTKWPSPTSKWKTRHPASSSA